MNAYNYKPNPKITSKTPSSVPTIVDSAEKSQPKDKQPKKLQANSRTHVEASKAYPYIRRPKVASPVKKTTTGPIIDKKIGLKTKIKGYDPSLNKSTSMAERASNLRTKSSFKNTSTSLPGRVASTTRVGPTDPTSIQGRLKKKSPWFSAIMDPMKGGGVKIPDPIGTDTGTYQHVQNVSVSVNAQGISGLRIICPYVNNYHFGGPDDDGSNYQTTTDPSALSDLKWGVTPTPGTGAYPFSKIPAIMKANAQSHRVVSACVFAQPEVSTLSDAGEMCAFVKPFDANRSDVPYSTLQTQWDTALMPVNKHTALIARWYPLSSDFSTFNTAVTHVEEEPSTVSYQDFIDPDVHFTDPNTDQGVIPWEIGVVCTGMTPSTGLVRFTIVVNYEFIPKSITSMISAAPSPIDPTEDQLVNSWVSDCPVTGPISQKVASTPPMESTVSERNEPTGFGMLFNVIEEMAPLIKTGLSLL